jgi:hypothetical protein
MRAFLKDLDRSVLVALVAGLAIGIVWLIWTGPGFMLAWAVLVALVIGLLVRRRWLEVGALMIGAGLVPSVGYLLLGPPDPPPRVSVDALPVEYWAQSSAELLLIGGVVAFVVAAVFGITAGRRREAREAGHEARKRQRLES